MHQPSTASSACRACGAPLASDQRYCLSCGARVAPPRLDFLAEVERAEAERAAAGASARSPARRSVGSLPLSRSDPTAMGSGATGDDPAGGSMAEGPAPTPGASAPSWLDRVGGPMGAAAVVLVALGVGFLIGRGGDDPPVAQRAPVVNIQGGALGAQPATATTPLTTPDATADDDADAAAGAGRSAARGGGAAARRAASENAARVIESTRDIPKSDGTEDTGGDIDRLRAQPDVTATPGAPPPTDDEPAGGGSEALSIG